MRSGHPHFSSIIIHLYIATVVYDATQMNSQSRSVSKYVKRIGMRDFNEVNKFKQGKKTVQNFFFYGFFNFTKL